MKNSFQHLLKRPLVWIYLAATAIGNTSFLYSVFGIFMVSGFAIITGGIVGIVIGIGLLALHHAISKNLVLSKIGICFSWIGTVFIMGLSVVGWFLIFHHVTFGMADIQYRKEILIQTEFKRIEAGNERFIDSLRINYQNNYSQAIRQRSPKTAREANRAIMNLANSKMRIDKETVNNKLNLIFEGNSFSNILLSYIARFRKASGDRAAEILLWIFAILISGGIDVCGFAFNRVTKDIENDIIEIENVKDDEIDLFDDATEIEEFEDEYYINNSDENTSKNVTPKIKKNPITVTNENEKMSPKKREIEHRRKQIGKLIQDKKLTQEEIGKKLNVNRRTIIRDLAEMNGELDDGYKKND